MKKTIKNIPLPIAGLMLGLAGLGNLIKTYGNHYRLIAGLLSSIIALFLLGRFIIDHKNCINELNHPIIASVALTFPMGIMILSTYLIQFSYQLALYSWYTGIIMHAIFILLFSLKFIKNFDIKKVFPSYFIVYVGIVVGSVTAPVFENLILGHSLFYFGFISYMVLLPIVIYRVLKIGEIKKPALPTISIFTAPAGLCLAGYMSSFPEKNLLLLGWLTLLTIISITAVILYLPKMLSVGFYPSFSAFTFPFVITAIGLKMTNNYLVNEFKFSLLTFPAQLTEILSVLLVSFVLFKYSTFLFSKQNT
mgnify:CR=1 FL=1